MKNILLILVSLSCFVLFSQVIQAAEPSFYYKANDNISLNIGCFLDGGYCSKNASCNITIDYPSTTNLIKNVKMINNTAYHTYYITNATGLGDYNVITMCTDNAKSGFSAFTIQINNVGKKIENFGVILFLLFLFFIVCGILTVVFLIHVPMLGYPFLSLSSFLLTILMFFLYINTMGLSRIFYVFYWISLLVLFGIVMLSLWMMTQLTVTYLTRKKRRDFHDNY